MIREILEGLICFFVFFSSRTGDPDHHDPTFLSSLGEDNGNNNYYYYQFDSSREWIFIRSTHSVVKNRFYFFAFEKVSVINYSNELVEINTIEIE